MGFVPSSNDWKLPPLLIGSRDGLGLLIPEILCLNMNLIDLKNGLVDLYVKYKLFDIDLGKCHIFIGTQFFIHLFYSS